MEALRGTLAVDRGRAWLTLWDKKGTLGLTPAEGSTLRRLLATDGFEAGLGLLTEDSWREWVDCATSMLRLQPGHRFLDLGCGAGPMLYSLNGQVGRGVGIDYSETMLRVAQHNMPAARLARAEAASLPFRTDSFDRILSSGVFLYFPDFGYARRAVEDMARACAPGGRFLIMDVPDLARKDEAERRRAEPSDRKRLSADPALNHLYYPRSFFQDLGGLLGARVEVVDQAIRGYANGDFRYNVLYALEDH